jgi:hypothetical protein
VTANELAGPQHPPVTPPVATLSVIRVVATLLLWMVIIGLAAPFRDCPAVCSSVRSSPVQVAALHLRTFDELEYV